MSDDALHSPDELHWQRSYNRADVDRFIAEVEAEKARLLEQIAVAQERIRCAHATAASEVNVEAALGAAVLRGLRAHRELEQEHADVLARVHAIAEEEAARRLDEARREVAEIHRTMDALLALARLSTSTPDDRSCTPLGSSS